MLNVFVNPVHEVKYASLYYTLGDRTDHSLCGCCMQRSKHIIRWGACTDEESHRKDADVTQSSSSDDDSDEDDDEIITFVDGMRTLQSRIALGVVFEDDDDSDDNDDYVLDEIRDLHSTDIDKLIDEIEIDLAVEVKSQRPFKTYIEHLRRTKRL